MNKEFKFWCKGTSPNPNFNKKGWWTFPNYVLSKYYSGLSIFESEDFVSCQSTGLTDSTGRKIFEGDIVGYKQTKWEVVWNNGGFFEIKDGEYLWEVCNKMKVIGNIFETPELLK